MTGKTRVVNVQSVAAFPIFSAPVKYGSGWGFPSFTSPAVIRRGGSGRPAVGRAAPAYTAVAEVTIAHTGE